MSLEQYDYYKDTTSCYITGKVYYLTLFASTASSGISSLTPGFAVMLTFPFIIKIRMENEVTKQLFKKKKK